MIANYLPKLIPKNIDLCFLNLLNDITFLLFFPVLAAARGLTPEDAVPGGVDPRRGQAVAGVGVKTFSRG